MSAQEQLRGSIDQRQKDLRASIPSDREAAILALLRSLDRLPPAPDIDPQPDLVTGRRLAGLGGNKALQLCLESSSDESQASPRTAGEDLDIWSERFLRECAQLAEAVLVLSHCETGFMHLVDDGHGTFDAWIATKRMPTSWRERTDFDWWASWLARRHEPERLALQTKRPDTEPNDPGSAASYRQLAATLLKIMSSYQLGYPPDAIIGDCSIQTYSAVLRWLIARALQARDSGEAASPYPTSSSPLRSRPISPSIPRSSVGPFLPSRSIAKTRLITLPFPALLPRRSFG